MKTVKVLLERKLGQGVMNMMTDLPINPDLEIGSIISIDDKNTQWEIKKIYEEAEHSEGHS